LPVDDHKMMRMGNEAAEAIQAVNGRKYKVGAAGKIFYPAGKTIVVVMTSMDIFDVVGGASDDFAKDRARIPYSVTVELPGDDW